MSEFVDRFSVTDESGNIKKEININFGDPLAREQSQRAVTTSEQAKQTANEAKQTANEAKQIAQEAKNAVPGEVSQQVDEATQELSSEVAEAKQIAQEAEEYSLMPNGGYTTNKVVNRYILAVSYPKMYPLLKFPTEAPDNTFFLDGNKGAGYYIKCPKKDGTIQSIELRNGYNAIKAPLKNGGSVVLFIYAIFDKAFYSAGSPDSDAEIDNEEFKFTDKICGVSEASTYEAIKVRDLYFNDTAVRAMNTVAINYMLSGGQKRPKSVIIQRRVPLEISSDNIDVPTAYYDNLNYYINYSSNPLGNTAFTGGNLIGVLFADCTDLNDIRRLFGSGAETIPSLWNRHTTHALGISNYEQALLSNGASYMFWQLRHIEVVEFVENENTEINLSNINLKGMFGGTTSLRSVRLPNIDSANIDNIIYQSRIKEIDLNTIANVLSLKWAIAEAVDLETCIMDAVNCEMVADAQGFAWLTYNLKNFSGLSDIKVSYTLEYSKYLTHESALNCIAGLYDLTEGGTVTDYTAQTLTFHPDVTAQLTEEEIAEATAKGWNIA